MVRESAGRGRSPVTGDIDGFEPRTDRHDVIARPNGIRSSLMWISLKLPDGASAITIYQPFA